MRLAAARLAERHGVDLHQRPDRARAVLGEQVWPLLDPAVPASDDRARSARTVPGALERIVQRLEAL